MEAGASYQRNGGYGRDKWPLRGSGGVYGGGRLVTMFVKWWLPFVETGVSSTT